MKNSIYSSCPEDIDDCLQIFYITILESKGIDIHINLRGWLFKTARNIVCKFNRKYLIEKKHLYIDNDNEYNQIIKNIESKTDIEEDFIDKEEYFRLKNGNYKEKILESLTKNETDLFDLKYNLFYSNEQISKILNISDGAVATRCVRLKRKIKNIFKNL